MRVPKRLPMRLWIKEKLDKSEFPGMKWIDREQGKFEVSWTHGSRQTWDQHRDLMVFKSWAMYTGKFNHDQPIGAEQAKRWKTNFRCALNALPEIELIREESEGKGARARKVYRMKHDRVIKTKARKIKEIRKRIKTDLEPSDQEIIEIVNEMEDDLTWRPLLIRSDQDSDGLSEIKDLLEKGQVFQPYSGWHNASLVQAF